MMTPSHHKPITPCFCENNGNINFSLLFLFNFLNPLTKVEESSKKNQIWKIIAKVAALLIFFSLTVGLIALMSSFTYFPTMSSISIILFVVFGCFISFFVLFPALHIALRCVGFFISSAGFIWMIVFEVLRSRKFNSLCVFYISNSDLSSKYLFKEGQQIAHLFDFASKTKKNIILVLPTAKASSNLIGEIEFVKIFFSNYFEMLNFSMQNTANEPSSVDANNFILDSKQLAASLLNNYGNNFDNDIPKRLANLFSLQALHIALNLRKTFNSQINYEESNNLVTWPTSEDNINLSSFYDKAMDKSTFKIHNTLCQFVIFVNPVDELNDVISGFWSPAINLANFTFSSNVNDTIRSFYKAIDDFLNQYQKK